MSFSLKPLSAAILFSIAAPAFAADAKHHFNIPPQPLDSAIQQLATQAGMSAFFTQQVTSGKQTSGLKGTYSTQEAADLLLAQNGLAPVIADGTISVTPAKSKASDKAVVENSNDNPTVLETVNVTDTAVKTTTKNVDAPDNKDYKITNAVTATKTDTPLMQTPMSVKVVSQQVLKDQQVITVDQALRNVSGAVAGAGGTGTFFLRGFGNFNIYRDGFLNQSQWSHTEDLTNVERVEVLKGPGSILYGRSEPGGLINFVTKQPLDTPYYSIRQQFGSFDHYRTNLDVGGALTENKELAYRFNLGYQTNNTFQEFGGNERLFVAPTLRWKISDKTTSTLKIEYSDIKETGNGTVPLMGNRPAPISRSQNLGDKWNLQEDEYIMVSLNTEHAFNDNWKLRHRFNFSNHELTMSAFGVDGNWSPVAANGDITRSFFAQNTDGKDYQHNFFTALELTGKFTTGFAKHTLLMGGDYYLAESRATMAGFGANPNQYDLSNIYAPVHQATAPLLTAADVTTSNSTLPWFGIYLQDQIELPYHVHLLGGFRYDNADTNNIATGEYAHNRDRTHEDKISPRGGIVWQPIPQLSLYGSYTENFGASNGVSRGLALKPQTAQQWETGIKTELFDGRFNATLAYFDLKKQNLAVSVDPFTTLAVGKAESRGLEFDVSGEILPGWNIIGAYAYTPFAKTIDNGVDAATGLASSQNGKRLNNAPKNSGSLWTTYEAQQPMLQGLKLGAGLQAVGKREIGYNETAQAAGYVTMGLMASHTVALGKSKITAQLNVDNLLDKTYTASIYSYGPTNYGAPRTFMGSLKVEY